jgi:hypothetical protein
VTGTFAIDAPRCVKRRNKLRAWVVAVDQAGTASEPRGLAVPPRCTKAAKQASKHR